MFCRVEDEDSKHFPKIDDISDDFVCKSKHLKIGEEKGRFYGPFDKKTDQPDGYGVFKTDWHKENFFGSIICGKVRNGQFADGRLVAAKYGGRRDIESKLDFIRLVDVQHLADGTLLEREC